MLSTISSAVSVAGGKRRKEDRYDAAVFALSDDVRLLGADPRNVARQSLWSGISPDYLLNLLELIACGLKRGPGRKLGCDVELFGRACGEEDKVHKLYRVGDSSKKGQNKYNKNEVAEPENFFERSGVRAFIFSNQVLSLSFPPLLSRVGKRAAYVRRKGEYRFEETYQERDRYD